MTTREAYVLGWVFGRLEVALKYDYGKTGFKVCAANERPYTGFSQIHSAAIERGVISEDVTRDLYAALDEINSTGPAVDGSGAEVLQPLPNQASWDLGRYKALGGSPLPPPASYDIKSKRQAKGMTQAQLADALGADQAQVSRWEKGVNIPTEETAAKIRELLG